MSGDDEKHGGKPKRKKYEGELRKLQAELCRLQAFVTPPARAARSAPSRSA